MKPFHVCARLRCVAQISKSIRNKGMVAKELRSILAAIRLANDGPWPVTYTTYDNWEQDLTKSPQNIESADWIDYLKQDESHAVIVHKAAGHAPLVITVGAGGGQMYALDADPELLETGVTPNDFEGPFSLDGDGLGELVNTMFS